MTSPTDVAAFHAEYDHHTDDRVRLFEAVAQHLPLISSVLYPGSYVDIAPSVWFDDVTYVDVDKRAARFFGESDAVSDLVMAKRRTFNPGTAPVPAIQFYHLDYQSSIPMSDESVDMLVSLYAGFIFEYCTEHLKIGGTLLVNPSHGDAAMASIDPRFELAGVVKSSDGRYSCSGGDLDSYLVPKKPQEISVETLQASGRGIAYTRPAFAYLFTRVA